MANPNAPKATATQEDILAATSLSAQWVIERLMAIASADFSKVLEVDGYGFPSVNLDLLDNDMKQAIQEISTTGSGNNKRITIKPADKLKALDMLGKYLSLFKDQVEIQGELSIVERLQEGRARMNRQQEEALNASDGRISVH